MAIREEITRENYVKPHHLLFFHPTINMFKSPADEIKTNQSQRQMNVYKLDQAELCSAL